MLQSVIKAARKKAIKLVGGEIVHLVNNNYYDLNKLTVGDWKKIMRIHLSLSRFLETHSEYDFHYYVLTEHLEAILQVADKRHRGRFYRKGVKDRVFKRDGYKCLCCGVAEKLTIDHITPLSSGGSMDEDNLQTLCFRCNLLKSQETKDWRVKVG